ncbi:MAG TPA: MvaI/BcnI family restriction endonuclease [Pyrinomonadaceae bacterium]|jgi:DNA mismatch repair protein MutH|nr:MvaI/BcnI family restriction endonuclease [Pyrinomonadaceae bacterium]
MNSKFWQAVRAAFKSQATAQQPTPLSQQSQPPQLSKRPVLDRDEAVRRINLLAGRDLRPLADELGVTVWKAGRKNKGWAGHVLERYLGLAQNSRQAPDFGTWDLKLVSLRRDGAGMLRVKETMAITMLEPSEVVSNRFEDSHLYDKLRRLVVVSRIFENASDTRSVLHAAAKFDLDDPVIFRAVRDDYELIRATIRVQGFAALTGDLGELIQARTKGRGHGSATRAFYARTAFIARMLNLHKLASMQRVFSSPHDPKELAD